MFGLDLIRAVAVSLVLLSHCGDMFAGWLGTSNVPVFSYGAYYGIELFFVLSGLLIGGLLIEQLGRGGPAGGRVRAWRIFMLRRWLRTLPLYYLWLAVLAVLWAPLLWGDPAHTAGAVLRYGALLQNLAWPMRDGDFFDVSWSLAVEEWFYLGFSAVLFAVAAVRGRAALPVAIGLFVAGPVALRWWLRSAPGGSDHLVIYWLDSIGVGVLAAWVAAARPRLFRSGTWLLPVAAGLIWLSYAGGLGRLGWSGHVRRSLDFDVTAVGLVLLLPAACRWRRAGGAAAAAVRAVSRYSYALYLTHLSVLVFIDAKRGPWRLSGWGAIGLSVALIVGLSYAMSRWVERPIMARRPDDRPRQPHQANPAMAPAPIAEASQA